MKSTFIFLILCFISLSCFSNENVEFTIHTNNSGNAFLLSAKGQTDNGSELVDSWFKKAKQLCGTKEIEVGPNNGKPIVRNTGCGDAIKMENGMQQCELIKASVFGKVACITSN